MVSKNLLIVHQQAGFTTFDQSLKTLRYIGSKIEHVSQIFFVVADNKILLPKKVGDVHVIPSKNRYREFSGWSAGIDYGNCKEIFFYYHPAHNQYLNQIARLL